MDAEKLQERLIRWTADNSGYEPERAYLGMSQMGKCPRRIFFEIRGGRDDDTPTRLRCYRGYLFEADIRERVARVVEGKVVSGVDLPEISALDGRFLGHPDGEIQMDGEMPVLLEIKSTTDERLAEIKERRRIPSAHWLQVQCYLHFGTRWDEALVVYVAVDSGDIYVHEVHAEEHIGRMCERKAREVLDALDKDDPPPCRCGRCRR